MWSVVADRLMIVISNLTQAYYEFSKIIIIQQLTQRHKDAKSIFCVFFILHRNNGATNFDNPRSPKGRANEKRKHGDVFNLPKLLINLGA